MHRARDGILKWRWRRLRWYWKARTPNFQPVDGNPQPWADPVDEDDVPEAEAGYTEVNHLWFTDKDAARAKVNELTPAS